MAQINRERTKPKPPKTASKKKQREKDLIYTAEYIPATAVQRKYGVSKGTLRNWAADARISVVNLPGGKRLYRRSELDQVFPVSYATGRIAAEGPPRAKIIYARVSSAHQQGDLQRQIEDLQKAYPQHELIKDIGSGLNWERPGLRSLLERTVDGMVEEVVVAHRDRLARFALELLEWLFRKFHTKLLVLDPSAPDSKQELSDDLLSIVTVFVARHNGRRAAENRRQRALLAEATEEEEEEEEPSDEEEEQPQPPRKRSRKTTSGKSQSDQVVSQ